MMDKMKEEFDVPDDFPASNRATARIIPLPDETSTTPWTNDQATESGVFGFESRDIRSRPFNLLRRRVLRQAEGRGWQLFGITSPTPRVGKSFIAANLAAALSRTPNIDVYLFDFDLRKSSVGGIFGVQDGGGLNQYLDGSLPTLETVARRIDGERLIVVPCTRSNAPSSELLGGEPMERLAEAMRQLPDNAICICDMPPVFANDDAAIIAARLDTYLLVLEDGHSTKKQLKDSMNLLSPAVCGGTVLNHYRGGLLSGDYGYGYGQDTSYGAYFG